MIFLAEVKDDIVITDENELALPVALSFNEQLLFFVQSAIIQSCYSRI